MEVDGEDRLYSNLDKIVKDTDKVSVTALEKAGMVIIGAAQRNLRVNGHNGGPINNTGRLSQSGRTQKNGDGSVDAGFFSDQGERGYAAAVEYGSRAHWPPIAPMEAWAHKKLRVPAKNARSVGFLIARAISRVGTRPHAFFKPAVDSEQNKALREIEAEIKKAIDK